MAPKLDLVRYREVRLADLRNDQKTPAQILNADLASPTQEQFQEFTLSQIKRIIHGSNTGLWKDDFSTQGIGSLQELSQGRRFVADCPADHAIGDFVRVTGPSVAFVRPVEKVNVADSSTMPAIGVIIDKSSATRALVLTLGEIEISPTILVPGKRYFLGEDSQLADAPPTPGPGQKFSAQVVGVAVDVGVLLVTPNTWFVVRVGD